jgi:N12 class adenine-specific DNA methylase
MNIHITESDRGFSKFEKLKDNFDWFYSNYDELKRVYNNQYVAVKEKRQIDSDYDLERLLRRLNLYNCNESIVIECVNN